MGIYVDKYKQFPPQLMLLYHSVIPEEQRMSELRGRWFVQFRDVSVTINVGSDDCPQSMMKLSHVSVLDIILLVSAWNRSLG